MRRIPPPEIGQTLNVWATLMHAFGTVEILERTLDLDPGPSNKGWQLPTWLAVCVDPFWAPYRGSLVVVRQLRSGTVFVLASDNDDVLFGDDERSNMRSFNIAEAALVPLDETASVTVLDRYVFRLVSAKLGNGFVEVDRSGIITQGTGEYGRYYIGMLFRGFLDGWEKADRRARYVRIATDWATSTR